MISVLPHSWIAPSVLIYSRLRSELCLQSSYCTANRKDSYDCRALCQLLSFDRLSFILSLYISLSFSLSQYTITWGSCSVDICITPMGGWKKRETSCSCEQHSDSITLPPKRITDMETMIWRMNGATFIRCSFIHLLDSLIWSQISCAPSFKAAGNRRNVWIQITDLKHYIDTRQNTKTKTKFSWPVSNEWLWLLCCLFF